MACSSRSKSHMKEGNMATTTATATYAMLWPDGTLDLPTEILDRLGITGGWQCLVEVNGDAITVRPSVAIPEEDLWAYTREHIAAIKEARAEPVEEALRLSPHDLRELMEGTITVAELRSRSRQ